MQRIVYAARRQVFRKLGFALGVLALGTAVLRVGSARWLGWSLVLAGGVYALVQVRALGEDAERVVIDDAGIRDSMMPVGIIGWDEIRGASVHTIGGIQVIELAVRDPERFIRRLPAGRQFIARKALAANLPGLYLTLVGTDADPTEIVKVIRRRIGLG